VHQGQVNPDDDAVVHITELATMRTGHLAALLLVPALGLSACVTTSATTTSWGDPPGAQQGWERRGRVEQIRETVYRQQGNPAGGAVAGAVVGGLLGHAIVGHGGGLVGALGGAAVGAAASQGSSEDRVYEVFVRFEDGGLEPFVYRGGVPFQIGDMVTMTPQGLYRQ
jgi:outer membrane lipoprotein SlyB